MTWDQADQRDKIRSQLRYEITHPIKQSQNKVDKPSSAIQVGQGKKSARAIFCERMRDQARTDPGVI